MTALFSAVQSTQHDHIIRTHSARRLETRQRRMLLHQHMPGACRIGECRLSKDLKRVAWTQYGSEEDPRRESIEKNGVESEVASA